MNKAAPKEPSMDEILSSIRQIIADDDAVLPTSAPLAAAAPRTPPMQATPAARPDPMAAKAVNFDLDDLPSFKPQGEPAGGRFPIIPPAPKPVPQPKTSLADVLGTLSAAVEKAAPVEVEDEPFALSATQIVVDEEEEAEPVEAFSFASILGEDVDEAPVEASFVDPEDISFEPEAASIVDFASVAMPEPVFQAPAPAMSSRQAARVADTAPMPDPTLSADIAEQLIEPATSAAVRHTFSKLGALNLANQGTTLESMMADMLRPMLKEWLDENLPSVVERMVEKEISRISRGLD